MPKHILVNGLSIGSGGGYTVGLELWRGIAAVRPDWCLTLALTKGQPLHEEAAREQVPENCRIHWSPQQTAGVWARTRYERTALVDVVRRECVDAVVQLNGMIVPGMPVPTLSHCQDPWPFVAMARQGLRQHARAFLKRREFARAFRGAACVGWTSSYLRQLMCKELGITPPRADVFYNGVPGEWVRRAEGDLPDWPSRPLQIVSISNVAPYKRQSLVIQAMPRLLARPELRGLIYRIAGTIDPDYQRQLQQMADRLGVGSQVIIEGRVSRERIEQLFSQSRCFVLMSLCESFGLPAIEAMSFGTPVVTSDCCAMPEVCGDAAELCPVDDPEALAERIARVLLDPSHADKLRERGRRRVGQFPWPRTSQRMAEALQTIS